VAWDGGWWDLFQRGEPLLWEQMTNASKRVLWMTPRYHVSNDSAQWAAQGLGTKDDIQLRWYDRFLKGKRNATDELDPVNLYTMGVNRWQHLRRWPVPARYTPFNLNGDKSGSAGSLNDGGLSTASPKGPGGDAAPLLPASSPCSRLTTQWTAGAASGPCETDNRTYEASSLTYSTKPLSQDMEVTGPITADLWAKLTSSEASLVAVVSDVDPSGQSAQISAGFLLASQRAIDAGKSTKGPGGIIIRPWHPFTRASQKPVPADQAQRYMIEIYPTSNVFKKGHRIRLTVGTANTPSTATPLPAQLGETGGQITLLREPGHASNLLLPVVQDSDVVGGGGLGCLARRSPIGPRNIGRVRLGMTKRQLLRRVPAPRRRTRRAWRWCVKGGGGTVRAAFDRKGRVELALTTAPHHGNRRIHPGISTRRLRAAYPRRRAIGRALFRANPRSPRLIGVRRGKVTYIAVAPRKLIGKRKSLSAYLRLARR
jgi:predicted acyl esterase